VGVDQKQFQPVSEYYLCLLFFAFGCDTKTEKSDRFGKQTWAAGASVTDNSPITRRRETMLSEHPQIAPVSHRGLSRSNALVARIRRLIPGVFGAGSLARTAPQIEIWHGLRHHCGHLGAVQDDFNVTGHVYSQCPIADIELTCSVNGETPRRLRLTRFRRIVDDGDFNADIPIATLRLGENRIVLTATDRKGGVATREVTVVRHASGAWPLPATVRWNSVKDPEDVGQFADGKWIAGPNGLRTVQIGYDRIFQIGNKTWKDYEVTATVTIHGLSMQNGTQSSTVRHAGFCLRWAGHSTENNRVGEQPKWGLHPRGGIVWLTIQDGLLPPVRQFYPGDSELSQTFDSFPIRLGQPVWMKGKCETLGPDTTRYSFKVWNIDSVEPAAWDFEVVQTSPSALRSGGVALVAHELDVTFGDILVTNLSNPNGEPAQSHR
jgi:hypothetical protein